MYAVTCISTKSVIFIIVDGDINIEYVYGIIVVIILLVIGLLVYVYYRTRVVTANQETGLDVSQLLRFSINFLGVDIN